MRSTPTPWATRKSIADRARCSPSARLYSLVPRSSQWPSISTSSSGLRRSQSAPLTAGAAALVIQAYRDSHHGASPTPDLVRRLLTSTSDDLGLPSSLQGAGLLDSLAAVKAARSVRGGSRPADGELVASVNQLNLSARAGGSATAHVRVTNVGNRPQVVRSSIRTTTKVLAATTKSVPFDRDSLPTFVDDVPHRVAVRDLAGMRIHLPRFQRIAQVRLWPNSVIATDDENVMRAKIGYTAIQAHLGELVLRLVQSHGLDEAAAWGRVRSTVDEVYDELARDPELTTTARGDHAFLTADTVPHKALLAMRLAAARGAAGAASKPTISPTLITCLIRSTRTAVPARPPLRARRRDGR